MTLTIDQLTTPVRHETDTMRFHGRLQELHEAQADFVIPQSAITLTSATRAALTAPVGKPFILPDGVATLLDAEVTRTAYRHLATRLRIPIPYLDRLLADDPQGAHALGLDTVARLGGLDGRSALVRLWQASDGWVLRAIVSDRYQAIDNFRVLLAVAQGMREAGVDLLGDCEVDADVTTDRLRLRIAVPQVALAVPDLLAGYRMPFSMREDRPWHARPEQGEVPPVLWAGIEVANSETGNGSFTIAPRAIVLACRNGMTRPVEFRRAHIGVQLDGGVVDWSDETRHRAVELIRSQVTDAVRTFVSAEYLQGIANEMREARNLPVHSPSTAIETVARTCELTEAEARSMADLFSRGNDQSVLGVGHALTAAAQLVEDTDRQSEMEAMFWRIVEQPHRFAGVS